MPDPANPVRLRKPANTAFKQQRLKAWQPILTPRTVLPTFFLLGLVFVPIGAWLLYVSNSVDELIFDYTSCKTSPTPPAGSPVSSWSYDSSNSVCTIRFALPKTFKAPVFLYYRLTNFYQNHRRYVKSMSGSQLKGEALEKSSLTDCSPLVGPDNSNLIYYPCGLIANSMFNDNIGVSADPTQSFAVTAVSGNTPYTFSCKGIAWPSDAGKYATTKYVSSRITPPKNWQGFRYRGQLLSNGSSWASYSKVFDPTVDEHFQNWVRTAGLPTFRKLYGRNMNTDMAQGMYELKIEYNFEVAGFDGTKSIVISTSSWLGGKNPFLGYAYIAVGSLCILLGIIFLVKHLVAPRKLGDHTYLSWNQVQANPSRAD